jgi:hypothetical protein
MNLGGMNLAQPTVLSLIETSTWISIAEFCVVVFDFLCSYCIHKKSASISITFFMNSISKEKEVEQQNYNNN